MKKASVGTAAIIMMAAATVGTNMPVAHADAAPGGIPSSNASCVGQVFVPQATGDPGAIADRIAFIKEFILPDLGINFGEPISGLARTPRADCSG
jgi:hypothetical protein